jgi:hypothetical protein
MCQVQLSIIVIIIIIKNTLYEIFLFEVYCGILDNVSPQYESGDKVMKEER